MNPTVQTVPWLKWPPDKKIWAGGIAGVLSWALLGVAAHFGLDLQPVANTVSDLFGLAHPDIQAILATVITLAVAHFTTPSIQDVVAHVNNAVVKIANADPANPTTAVVVSEPKSDEAAKVDAIVGAIPQESVNKMIDAGVIPPASGKVTQI